MKNVRTLTVQKMLSIGFVSIVMLLTASFTIKTTAQSLPEKYDYSGEYETLVSETGNTTFIIESGTVFYSEPIADENAAYGQIAEPLEINPSRMVTAIIDGQTGDSFIGFYTNEIGSIPNMKNGNIEEDPDGIVWIKGGISQIIFND